MKVNVIWNDAMQFQTQTPSGHTFLLDASSEIGGKNEGPRPTEVLLSAVGSCSGIDVVEILKKMRLQMDSLEIEVNGVRAEEHPRRFIVVDLHYRFFGELPEEKVRRAIQLSLDKYCSVAQSLNAEIRSTFSINGETFKI